MHSSERVARVSGVVKLGVEPACGAVAYRAIVGQPGGNVRRVSGRDKVRLMAGKTCGGCALESVVNVACYAVEGGVHPGQCKAGQLEVIELGPEPVVHRVTALTGSGEA